MQRFSGKVALITGGARGIGRATAEAFAAEGARVIVADVAADAAEATARALGGGAVGLAVDVGDPQSVKQLVATALSRTERIDVLINNAGITCDASLLKMSDEAWDTVIAVNLSGTFYMTREVAPHMTARGSGAIVNASSVVGVYGNFGQTNYVATKSGVIGMTRVWARELGRKGVRVNAIAPGFIATDMTAKMPEEVLDGMKKKTPLGRLGAPEDVAKAYLFLASDEASFINGQVLGVDGGLVAGT
ncbi:MAG: 3-oxoacyl-(acyl-carrier-protein) reductase [Myxococcales bacterium]|nr:3-oxoacyl-(acyl-carrier-protein) reductase [Myxococcales bacterium]